MRTIVLALLAKAFLIVGGATQERRYVLAGTSEEKMKQELESCRAQSQEARADVKGDQKRQRREQAELIDRCMLAKGYSRG